MIKYGLMIVKLIARTGVEWMIWWTIDADGLHVRVLLPTLWLGILGRLSFGPLWKTCPYPLTAESY